MSSRITEAIILAGGLGTRLRAAVPQLPKCMAPVAGRPFIDFVIDYALEQGIEQFILALGYQSAVLQEHLTEKYPHLAISYSVEPEPLGTGGAIQLACGKANTNNVLVLNGDTLFRYNLTQLSLLHLQRNAHCTLCLKPMLDFERYGVVETDANNRIVLFREKQFYKNGLINAGVYALDVMALAARQLPEKFSFEKDYLERFVPEGHLYGIAQDVYFIDIGIPEDFARAQLELA